MHVEKSKLKTVLVPLGLFVLSAGAYWLILSGIVPFGLDTPLVFAAIAGVTALGAVRIGAQTPALTAGIATLGFSLSIDDSTLLIGSVLATLGVLGYGLSMVYHIGTRVYTVSPVLTREDDSMQ